MSDTIFLSVQFHSFNQIRHSKGSELTFTSVYVVFFFSLSDVSNDVFFAVVMLKDSDRHPLAAKLQET